MNEPQEFWWEQTRSDLVILLLLRKEGVTPCHQLHYLRMVTEKLAKAYFWRSGKSPKTSHVGFVRFLTAINNRSKADRTRIALLLGFDRVENFEYWISAIAPIAYGLERLAPALSSDGPNPEYPWPTAWPTNAPATSKFVVWDSLCRTSYGRRLLKLIESAVAEFPKYA